MGDSGGGLTGPSYDWDATPIAGLVIGLLVFDLIAIGGLVCSLPSLFDRIFEEDSGGVTFLSFFTLFWIGVCSSPGIILVASSDHPAGLIVGYVNLGFSAIPVLVFLLLVVANSVRLRVEAHKKAQEQAQRQAAGYRPPVTVGYDDPPASVPNVAADGHV